MTPLRVFIGYDEREAIAYHVLAHSILRRASGPVAIIPLRRESLTAIHTRPKGPLESTDFSITRFLAPYLSWYAGISVYLDCDMLCRGDIYELTNPGWPWWQQFTVRLVKHEYTTKQTLKFLGQENVPYPRKNWSSLMVFNNAGCGELTKEYVNEAPALDLHRFSWCPDGNIGSIGPEWNWLVGEYEPNPDAKILHYTLGGPWFPEYRNCDHADLWFEEYDAMFGNLVKAGA